MPVPSEFIPYLQGEKHVSRLYLTVNPAPVLWQAQVTAFDRDEKRIILSFGSGSGSYFSLVTFMQEVWVGTAAGLDNIGRLRLKENPVSGDGGVSGTVEVAASGIPLAVGQHLTFKFDYPLKPRYSYMEKIDEEWNAAFYKDGDISYTLDLNIHVPPIVIAGGPRAGFIREGQWRVIVDLRNSYSLDPDATITGYNAIPYAPNGGVTVNASYGGFSGVFEIIFTVPGPCWMLFWVQSTAGAYTPDQYGWRFYYAHDEDPTSVHHPIVGFQLASLSHAYTRDGWSAEFTITGSATEERIPENALALIWQEASYAGDLPLHTLFSGNAETYHDPVIAGYISDRPAEDNLETGVGRASFFIETPNGKLNRIYMDSISLSARPHDAGDPPADWYEYRKELTVGRAIHHAWLWHTTAFYTWDVWGLGNNTDAVPYSESMVTTALTMANSFAYDRGIRARIVCTKDGTLRMTQDLQLLTDAERAALPVAYTLTVDDIGGELTIGSNTEGTAAKVTTSGFSWPAHSFSTPATPPEDATDCERQEFDECTDPPCPDVVPHCASAPGVVAWDWGAQANDYPQQIFRDQAHANAIAGRFFARDNNPHPEVRVIFGGNWLPFLESGWEEFWQITLSPLHNTRYLAWTNQKLILRDVEARYSENGVWTCNVVFEPEAWGYDGVGFTCPSLPCVDTTPEPGGFDEITPDPGGTEEPEPPEPALCSLPYTPSVFGVSYATNGTEFIDVAGCRLTDTKYIWFLGYGGVEPLEGDCSFISAIAVDADAEDFAQVIEFIAPTDGIFCNGYLRPIKAIRRSDSSCYFFYYGSAIGGSGPNYTNGTFVVEVYLDTDGLTPVLGTPYMLWFGGSNFVAQDALTDTLVAFVDGGSEDDSLGVGIVELNPTAHTFSEIVYTNYYVGPFDTLAHPDLVRLTDQTFAFTYGGERPDLDIEAFVVTCRYPLIEVGPASQRLDEFGPNTEMEWALTRVSDTGVLAHHKNSLSGKFQFVWTPSTIQTAAIASPAFTVPDLVVGDYSYSGRGVWTDNIVLPLQDNQVVLFAGKYYTPSSPDQGGHISARLLQLTGSTSYKAASFIGSWLDVYEVPDTTRDQIDLPFASFVLRDGVIMMVLKWNYNYHDIPGEGAEYNQTQTRSLCYTFP